MAAEKSLVALSCSLQEKALQHLEAQGWQVLRVAELAQFKLNRQLRRACAVLVRADERILRGLDKLRTLAAGMDLEWVMLLEREQLDSADVCAFINDVCYDYHCLPLDAQRLEVMLGRLHGKTMMRRALAVPDSLDEAGDLVGEHPLIRQLRHDIRRLARIDVNVLIQGESGTGKELVAKMLHQQSGRSEKPLLAVNCGGLPAQLVQSELFGHERGAFTGANEKRVGRVEAASGGTLFLDEIGDMPLEAQASLLRFLQEGTIDRVGSSHSVRVDARVLSATHVDLPRAVGEGHFRADLYYRLNVCQLEVPPLRERRTDIPLLARYLLDVQAQRMGVPRKGFSSEAIAAMTAHDWPGNVRELINRISHALVMARSKNIKAADLKLSGNGESPVLQALDDVREKAERDALALALRLHGENAAQAARMLGVSRATFYRLLQKHQLTP